MNDFTKEELEALADSYEQRLHSGYVIHMELLHKIQSMINSYCEHESLRSISNADYVFVCGDCNKVIKYE